MNEFICDICTREFKRKISLFNHRRWHPIPENMPFINKIKSAMKGNRRQEKTHTQETKNKQSISKLGDKNPMWKGDKVSYPSIHSWIGWNKPKSETCQNCGRFSKRIEAANISGKYKRDIDDYVWLCKQCHTDFDKIRYFKIYYALVKPPILPLKSQPINIALTNDIHEKVTANNISQPKIQC